VAGRRAGPLGIERRSGRLLGSIVGRELGAASASGRRLLVGAAIAAPVCLLAGFALLTVLLGGAAAASACPASAAEAEGSGALNEKGIPAELVPIIRAAASRYELGPRGPAILAAILKVESDFGRNMGPSSAGAEGWTQFMPATWDAYGVDANRDGRKDPRTAEDAIHAAARYLKASGAPKDWDKALFAYNHALWYQNDLIYPAAKRFGDPGAGGDGNLGSGAAAPSEGPAACTCAASAAPPSSSTGPTKAKIIQGPYEGTHSLGNWQSDRAIDIALPMGTPLVAIESGVVTKTGGQASLEGRFGGYSLTLAGGGNAFFYTHLKKLKVRAGDRVRAGEVVGYSGKANDVEHLHLGVRDGDPREYANRVLAGETATAAGADCPDGAEPGAASATELLRNRNLTLSNDLERRDLASGKIDARVVAILAMLVREHKVTVTALASDHDPGTNHEPGRAVDIGSIDGERCDGSRSGKCGQVAIGLARIRGRYEITELIYCFDPGPGSGSFARADHCDHVHVGYDR